MKTTVQDIKESNFAEFEDRLTRAGLTAIAEFKSGDIQRLEIFHPQGGSLVTMSYSGYSVRATMVERKKVKRWMVTSSMLNGAIRTVGQLFDDEDKANEQKKFIEENGPEGTVVEIEEKELDEPTPGELLSPVRIKK